jgi:hypothetical protein
MLDTVLIDQGNTSRKALNIKEYDHEGSWELEHEAFEADNPMFGSDRNDEVEEEENDDIDILSWSDEKHIEEGCKKSRGSEGEYNTYKQE